MDSLGRNGAQRCVDFVSLTISLDFMCEECLLVLLKRAEFFGMGLLGGEGSVAEAIIVSTFSLRIIIFYAFIVSLALIKTHAGSFSFSAAFNVFGNLDCIGDLAAKVNLSFVFILCLDLYTLYLVSRATNSLNFFVRELAYCYSLQDTFVAEQLFQGSENSSDDLLWLCHTVLSSSKVLYTCCFSIFSIYCCFSLLICSICLHSHLPFPPQFGKTSFGFFFSCINIAAQF